MKKFVFLLGLFALFDLCLAFTFGIVFGVIAGITPGYESPVIYISISGLSLWLLIMSYIFIWGKKL